MPACACAEKDLYLSQPAVVLRKTPATALEMLFEVQLDQPFPYLPGQFVEVSLPGIGEAPISICSSPSGGRSFEMLVRKAGRMTAALHGLKEGARLGIRGPYGTHFPVDGEMKGRDVLFVAGGIGLAPLRSAILYTLERRADYGKVTILYGTKSPAERLFLKDLAAWAARSDVQFLETVDRAEPPWSGNVGVITTLIPKARIDPARAIVVACGPPIMYKFVIVSLYALGITHPQIVVSLERRMKCGVGKCGHCQINGLYACLDGPVFRYDRIADMQEAI
jgi:NAD(P)H-flavin reductase